jgi:hypothetical protein
VVSGNNEGVVGLQCDERSPVAWSASSIASTGDTEWRPEHHGRRWPSVLDHDIDSLRDLAEGGHQQEHQREGRGLGE